MTFFASSARLVHHRTKRTFPLCILWPHILGCLSMCLSARLYPVSAFEDETAPSKGWTTLNVLDAPGLEFAEIAGGPCLLLALYWMCRFCCCIINPCPKPARQGTTAPPFAMLTSTKAVCPKCGTVKKSDKRSCCARGGAWFKNCGDAGDTQFDHTWLEGVQACKSKFM